MATKLENDLLQQLCCTICENPGSFPLSVHADGRIICSKCEPNGDICPSTSGPVLKTMLLNTKQSACKLKQSGCEEVLPYHAIKKHELKCVYQPGLCMVAECNWKGLQVDLYKHFSDKHKSHFCLSEFRLPAFSVMNTYDVLVALIEGILFIMEYKYEPDKLYYRILYVSSYVKTAAYTIYNDKTTKLSEGKCINFDNSILGQYSNCEVLNTKDIQVSTLVIQIAIIKYKYSIVDYSLIERHKCFKCMGYLVPLPFDLQPFGSICGFCAAQSKEAVVPAAHALSETIKSANFPCRWKYCNFISNSKKMYMHEKSCRFRMHKCLVDPTCPPLDIIHMKFHLKHQHSITYFNKKYCMTELATEHLFTIKDNIFVLVSTVVLDTSDVRVVVKTTRNRNHIPVYVQCHHDHCNITSRVFCVIGDFILMRNELPICFKEYNKFSITFQVR